MNLLKLKIYKLMHWEYWPMKLVYFPILPIWLYYALKAKSFFFFNAANPSIKNGGMAMESKKEIYDLIPTQYIPKTILIKKTTDPNNILQTASNAGIHFPMIAKPDIGMKAFGVEMIKNKIDLKGYINKIPIDYLIQEYIYYPKEMGIFYVRLPHEKVGKITGIVSKEFLSITGNGRDSILQLIKQNPRSYFQLAILNRKYGDFLNTILPSGEIFFLVTFGSHTRGAKFTDITNKLNDKLSNTINTICTQIPGFYYGRLDIRYSSFEELCEGEKFSIIEINGAGSEPTHIYDPSHTILFAWKEITKHWKLLYQISILNFKNRHSYLSFKEGREMMRANSELEAQLKIL